MTLKERLKKNQYIYGIYKWAKEKKRTGGKYKFINRSENRNKLCIVLAGYKEYLWDSVFDRLFAFVEKDIDVCIISSGVYSEDLALICQNNNWSYLSTQKNKLTLAQNIAILLHPNAELIYKLDEDIFITENYFQIMEQTYVQAQKDDKYEVGFVGALLTVHGYGFLRVLEKLNKVEQTEKIFGHLRYGEMGKNPAYTDPNFAKYMWGDGLEELQNIDKVAKEFQKEDIKYELSPFRFAIGAILMPRQIWEDMGKFPVTSGWNMGVDETSLNTYCFLNSKVIVVAENTLVGHFAYFPQNEAMKLFYSEHKENFRGEI